MTDTDSPAPGAPEVAARAAATSLALLAASTDRLLRTAAALDPQALAGPSALPGWTRGHVLAHIARNADSLVNLLDGARTGTDIPQYATPETRDRDIETGAPRPLDVQLADIRDSAVRFTAAAAELDEKAWTAEVRHRSGITFEASEIPWKRLMEVEYHHVDLAAGHTPAHWPEEFATAEFRRLAARLDGAPGLPAVLLVADDTGERVRTGDRDGGPALTAEGPVRALTAWLSGRSAGDGLQVHQDGRQLADARAALPELPPLG
ncbi:maleylpyruvate isomerase family mycothiol-dependent enzyme [Kitasatospora indigofera]|uniref:maleylpyruvate isomerase family mycothiol-dependent enzyme n=1 Tax=Kitasatospora indigofera TaxID=67307 RepID=UPI0036D1683E